MFDKIEIFRMSQGLAKHAAARQSTIAQNVANADTPGYQARDIASFAETYETNADHGGMRATRAKHFGTTAGGYTATAPETIIRQGATSPNGNSVSLESEMMAAAEAKSDHNLALAVYNTSMNIMRASIGRR
ncbi:FlgB family protein [Aliiroseovarius lamellibrachiae]|uniref:FlgB family protein n=1 Tax=Aliiroseovarius lamellibrachiae TaxID=1924933 RepID=UPI001BE0CDAB|nr:FlgB family protein [Aliiroseovarius lamellibrachiae]MBT2132272.1 FlgB family protein [Aliiroseovarius lamellibrachiae]